jgi:hypothetical protein
MFGWFSLPGERGFVEEELLEALGFLLAHLDVGLGDLDGDLAVVERVFAEEDVGGRALSQLAKGRCTSRSSVGARTKGRPSSRKVVIFP